MPRTPSCRASAALSLTRLPPSPASPLPLLPRDPLRSIEVGRNIIHGSDTVENAQKEIKLWFPEGISAWTPALKPWIYE